MDTQQYREIQNELQSIANTRGVNINAKGNGYSWVIRPEKPNTIIWIESIDGEMKHLELKYDGAEFNLTSYDSDGSFRSETKSIGLRNVVFNFLHDICDKHIEMH